MKSRNMYQNALNRDQMRWNSISMTTSSSNYFNLNFYIIQILIHNVWNSLRFFFFIFYFFSLRPNSVIGKVQINTHTWNSFKLFWTDIQCMWFIWSRAQWIPALRWTHAPIWVQLVKKTPSFLPQSLFVFSLRIFPELKSYFIPHWIHPFESSF